MTKKNIYAIVDVGGTKILLLLVQEDGTVIYRKKHHTLHDEGSPELDRQINSIIQEALDKNTPLKGVGVCVAALIDYNTGELVSAPNLPTSPRYPLREKLRKEWSVPVLVENDGNAAVLGEVHCGAAQGMKNVIYVTVSTGIGAGFFLQGRLYRGTRGFASELGHIKSFGGLNCSCGGEGCLETEASGEAISRKANELFNPDQIDNLSTREVFEEKRRGNIKASELVDDAVEKLGNALANLVTLLDPQAIVIGGGVSAEEAILFPGIKKRLCSYSFNPVVDEIKLCRAELDPESGIWGMYSLLLDI